MKPDTLRVPTRRLPERTLDSLYLMYPVLMCQLVRLFNSWDRAGQVVLEMHKARDRC